MVLVCYILKDDNETSVKSAKYEIAGNDSFNALGIGVRFEVGVLFLRFGSGGERAKMAGKFFYFSWSGSGKKCTLTDGCLGVPDKK